MDQQGKTGSESINVKQLREQTERLNTAINKHANNIPPVLFNDLQNIHRGIEEACGWTTTQETGRAAGVGGASNR